MEVNRRTNEQIEFGLPAISYFIRRRRKDMELTQEEFAKHVGVGIAFLKRLEAGHENLHLGKVLQVLRTLGAELVPKTYQ